MINFSSALRLARRPILCIALAAILAPAGAAPAEGAEKRYKKSTSVDFEGALVEGKSRKPYSAYLTQQKDSAFSDLNTWAPDLDHSLASSQKKVGNSL